ncbi:hypothetical protein ACMFMG_008544 [Clarireedia jacksonii]
MVAITRGLNKHLSSSIELDSNQAALEDDMESCKQKNNSAALRVVPDSPQDSFSQETDVEYDENGDLSESPADVMAAARALVQLSGHYTFVKIDKEGSDRVLTEEDLKKTQAQSPHEMTEDDLAANSTETHRSSGIRGRRCIEDGTIDRSRAFLNNPRRDLLRIRLSEEWDNPELPGEFIKGRVDHVYGRKVNLGKREDVRKLNAWREQVIRRCVGKPYDNAKFWTIEERDILVTIVQTHQKGGDTIDWAAIAEAYNSRIERMVQQEGSMGAARQYNVPNAKRGYKRQAFIPSLPLRQNRRVPLRTAHELRQEMSYFRDDSAARVMAKIREHSQKEINYD